MIYTLTLNPSLDYMIYLEDFQEREINIFNNYDFLPGGKGINVATVLTNLENDVVALGFVGGFTGKQLIDKLNLIKVKTDFVELESGENRVNVKIKSITETEINGEGPDINNNDLTKLFDKLSKLEDGDILVLSGSIPNCLSQTIYQEILYLLKDKEIKVCLDCRNELLTNCLQFKPFLIKPNRKELEEIFKVKIDSTDDLIMYAKKLQNMGAINVLVSMDSKGALLIDEFQKVHIQKAAIGKLVNSIGAGDSTVAGFITGYLNGDDYSEVLKLSVASGSASAFSRSLASKNEIFEILKGLNNET